MKLFLMLILRCCTAFIVAVYLALQGISFFHGLSMGYFTLIYLVILSTLSKKVSFLA